MEYDIERQDNKTYITIYDDIEFEEIEHLVNVKKIIDTPNYSYSINVNINKKESIIGNLYSRFEKEHSRLQSHGFETLLNIIEEEYKLENFDLVFISYYQ